MYQNILLRLFSIKNRFRNVRFNSNYLVISQILNNNKGGDEVQVKGWVKSIRNQKENIFIDLSDGSTDEKLQILVSKDLKPNGLTAGSSVTATGCLSLSPKGQIELNAKEVAICGECILSDGYPFAPRKQYSLEYVRQYLHLRPRTNKFGALLRLRSAATLAIHSYLNSENFININTPILTSNDCEGAGEVFMVIPDNQQVISAMKKYKQVDSEVYFNKKAFLTVSGQLHLEAAVHGISKVYTFGPTFRAENSKSRLHLSEFYMLEVEIAFIDNLEQILVTVENLIKTVTKSLLEQHTRDIEKYREQQVDPKLWIDKAFPILTYNEASKILEDNQRNFKEQFKGEKGFSKEHELFLVEHCGNQPVFVINWPKAMKPFYMKEIDNDIVAAFDLLGPIVGEVAGGSLREDNYDKLHSRLPNDSLDWYLNLRKFGAVPTGGFGLGFERYLQMILGVSNIKDTIPFPRWPHNCSL